MYIVERESTPQAREMRSSHPESQLLGERSFELAPCLISLDSTTSSTWSILYCTNILRYIARISWIIIWNEGHSLSVEATRGNNLKPFKTRSGGMDSTIRWIWWLWNELHLRKCFPRGLIKIKGWNSHRRYLYIWLLRYNQVASRILWSDPLDIGSSTRSHGIGLSHQEKPVAVHSRWQVQLDILVKFCVSYSEVYRSVCSCFATSPFHSSSSTKDLSFGSDLRWWWWDLTYVSDLSNLPLEPGAFLKVVQRILLHSCNWIYSQKKHFGRVSWSIALHVTCLPWANLQFSPLKNLYVSVRQNSTDQSFLDPRFGLILFCLFILKCQFFLQTWKEELQLWFTKSLQHIHVVNKLNCPSVVQRDTLITDVYYKLIWERGIRHVPQTILKILEMEKM